VYAVPEFLFLLKKWYCHFVDYRYYVGRAGTVSAEGHFRASADGLPVFIFKSEAA
jgi:hypothetical protein